MMMKAQLLTVPNWLVIALLFEAGISCLCFAVEVLSMIKFVGAYSCFHNLTISLDPY